MWKCPKCQAMCDNKFCPICGYQKPEELVVNNDAQAQFKELTQSVKCLQCVCIILAVAVTVLAILFVFAYNSVWENIVDLWENVEDIWDNFDWIEEGFATLWREAENIWNAMFYLQF